MPRSLSDAQVGDRYRVTVPGHKSPLEAVVMRLDDRLVAVVDYTPIGPVECLPVPWSDCEWEKK